MDVLRRRGIEALNRSVQLESRWAVGIFRIAILLHVLTFWAHSSRRADLPLAVCVTAAAAYLLSNIVVLRTSEETFARGWFQGALLVLDLGFAAWGLHLAGAWDQELVLVASLVVLMSAIQKRMSYCFLVAVAAASASLALDAGRHGWNAVLSEENLLGPFFFFLLAPFCSLLVHLQEKGRAGLKERMLRELDEDLGRLDRGWRTADREKGREISRLKGELVRREELDKLKSDFVANVSHELRAPLFAMGAALELLFEDGVDPDTERLRGVVRGNLARLRRLVSNILEYTKLESGVLKPAFRRTDLASIVRSAAADMEPLLASKFVEIRVDAPPEGVHAEVDPDQMGQVVSNLLSNAVKFTEAGGSLGVELSDGGGDVRLCVWDTGVGVPETDRERIFERFYQSEARPSRVAGGAGIGLALVKGYVELHRGRIWVESRPGAGSRFHVSLPKAREEER
jgi:signal transduction histidine kinase